MEVKPARGFQADKQNHIEFRLVLQASLARFLRKHTYAQKENDHDPNVPTP